MTQFFNIATPDNLVWPIDQRMEHVELVDNAIVVKWSNQETSRYHPLWLRDNCACESCLHQVNREHILDLRDIPLDTQADTVTLDEQGSLCINWRNQNHQSRFNPGWLYAHSSQMTADSYSAQAPLFWNSSDLPEPPSFNAVDQIVDDELLHQILLSVEKVGLARVRNLASSPDVVEAFGLRIGPIRETHFARVFDVISRADSDSNAYTSDSLSAHTDIPTRENPPGLQLLHCLIADADGGESTMTDGFKVAHDIGAQDPEAYANLTTTKWCFANRAGTTDYRWKAPVIGLDDQGNLSEVRLLPFSRAPLMTDYNNIEISYRALQLFMEMANSPEYQITYPFKAGDLIIFDNRRIMHGRTEFFPKTGDRKLRGVYVDRDDMYSRLRCYTNEINRRKAE